MTGGPHRFQTLLRQLSLGLAAARFLTSNLRNIGSQFARIAMAARRLVLTKGGVWNTFGPGFRVTEGASPFFQLQMPSRIPAVALEGVRRR
jgi:hypothetical protein